MTHSTKCAVAYGIVLRCTVQRSRYRAGVRCYVTQDKDPGTEREYGGTAHRTNITVQSGGKVLRNTVQRPWYRAGVWWYGAQYKDLGTERGHGGTAADSALGGIHSLLPHS
eukprot:3806808-Rhodomonas_salina.2